MAKIIRGYNPYNSKKSKVSSDTYNGEIYVTISSGNGRGRAIALDKESAIDLMISLGYEINKMN